MGPTTLLGIAWAKRPLMSRQRLNFPAWSPTITSFIPSPSQSHTVGTTAQEPEELEDAKS